MTQEDKELLLKDLCTRLPYGIIVKEQYGDYIHVNIYNAHLEHLIDRISLGLDKLVLRPMSSITTEEICKIENIIGDGFTYRGGTLTLNTEEIIRIPIYKIFNLIQFIYSRHLDFNNLIPMSLALEAPEGMYDLKENKL